MDTTPPSPRARLRTALATLVVAVLAAGCTDALRGDGGAEPDPEPEPERTVEELAAWPDDDVVARTTSPAHPEVEVAIRPLLREPDGTTTVLAEVTNQGSSDLDVRGVFGSDGLVATRIVDPESRVRHTPIASSSASYCLCTSGRSTVAAGSTVTAYVTFASVADDVEAVRVALPEWQPVDDVPVRDVTFPPATTAETAFDTDADRRIAVQGVWRTEDGLLVRVEDRNETAERLFSSRLADLTDVVVVDPATLRGGQPRTVEHTAVAEGGPDRDLPAGESIVRDVLVAAPAGDPDVVLVRLPDARRTLPVRVGSDAPATRLSPRGLDEPRTLALEGASRAEGSDLVALADPEDVPVSDAGPTVELPEPGEARASEAQPAWSVAPRAVVRTGSDRSTLYLDLTRGDVDRSWPEGLGSDLAELALIDPAEQRRSGVLEGSDGADGSTSSVSVPRRGTRTVHVAFPPVADGSRTVTVDVPGFGAFPDVPVLDGPEPAEAGDPVLASLPDDRDGRLRTDVLAVGRLPGDGGVLVRIRRVNVSAPDAYEPADPCDLSLSDPDSDRRFQPLRPCVATTWARPLGAGEALVQEVRLPTLPGDVDRVTIEGDGWLGSAPVPVADEVAPWYLDLPRPADSPRGDTLSASTGVADDLQTEVRDGGAVDLNLDTDVLFAFGSADLSPEAVARLEAVAERLAGDVSGTVTVVGHTDGVGDEAANQALSEQRARAVADVLAPILGSAVDLEVEGRGESEPIAPNEIDGRDNPDGRERNRRVTVTYDA